MKPSGLEVFGVLLGEEPRIVCVFVFASLCLAILVLAWIFTLQLSELSRIYLKQ